MKIKLFLFLIILAIFVSYLLFGSSVASPVIEKVSPILTTNIKVTPSPLQKTTLEKTIIKTAFVPQAPLRDWQQPWQDACEEAALLTVKYYYDHQNPDLESIKNDFLLMFEYEKQQGWGNDVNIDQMSNIARDYLNLLPTIIENPTISQLKSYLLDSIPIIVPASGKILFQENHNFSNGGPFYHNLVILGFNDKTSKFIVHDVGTRKGAYFEYSYSLLLESIHDLPPSGDHTQISSGPKKVLILQKLL